MQRININELETKMSEGDILIDVRTQDEAMEGMIEGAVLIDVYSPTFESTIADYDKRKNYFLYCRSGNRSGMAAQMMESMGFKNLTNLEGGMLDWMGKTVEKW